MFYLPNEEVQNAKNSEDEESDGERHLRQALRQVGLPAEEDPQRFHHHQETEQHQIRCQVATRIGKNWMIGEILLLS